MKTTFPSYFKKFSCIADKCPDTCCAGWEIVVDNQSIERYSALKTDYGNKINSLIATDADGDKIFVSSNGRCPFLLQNGLCEMYAELGHDALCLTCRKFPRHTISFGARSEIGLTLSCPEAARLIFENYEPITFETEETDDAIAPCDFDAELYFILFQARKKAIDILQNRNFSINGRLCSFLDFSQALSAAIRKYDYALAREITESDFSPRLVKFSEAKAKRALNKYISDFSSLEMLDPNWKNELSSAAENGKKDFLPEWEFEHLAVYFVFRYFTETVFDRDLLTKAKFTAVSLIIIRNMQPETLEKSERIKTAQKFSKEVEHSANNMDFLKSAIKKSRFYSIENIKNILSEREN